LKSGCIKSPEIKEGRMKKRSPGVLLVLLAGIAVFAFSGCAGTQKAGSKDAVKILIPANKGGGMDRITRFMIGLNEHDRYRNFALKPVNKPGGAGAVAMKYLLEQEGNGNVVISISNNFFSTPLFQRLPFSYRDFTPICLLGDDNFVLWVHKDAPWKTAGEFVQTAGERSIQVGGTGSKQEDEILFRAIEMNTMAKPFKYVPFKGGGSVARALVGKNLEATVNQVSELIDYYPEKVRPLCVFQDKRLNFEGLENVPTCREAGIPVSFHFLHGLIFAPPGISPERRSELINLFKHISETADWREFSQKVGWDPRFITGEELRELCWNLERQNREILLRQGWIRE
jgi:tripartite-type tricarboxylate transporter receptor subunit TctC